MRRNVPNFKVSSYRFERLFRDLPTTVGQIVTFGSLVNTFAETLTITSTWSSLIGGSEYCSVGLLTTMPQTVSAISSLC